MITEIDPRPARLITKAIVAYLRWRYGGDVDGLKPPLGYHPVYSPRPLWWRAVYRMKVWRWRAEGWLFARYGASMRHRWEDAFRNADKRRVVKANLCLFG